MMKRLDDTGHDLKWALKCLAAQLSIIQIETGLINPDFCHSLLGYHFTVSLSNKSVSPTYIEKVHEILVLITYASSEESLTASMSKIQGLFKDF